MSMTITEAKTFVAAELARIERENPVGVLQPWEPDACPAAAEWWGRVQQRTALNRRNLDRACLRGLDIAPPERSDAQKKASAAAGRRLATVRVA